MHLQISRDDDVPRVKPTGPLAMDKTSMATGLEWLNPQGISHRRARNMFMQDIMDTSLVQYLVQRLRSGSCGW